jgi:hypothetical protein
MISMIGVAQIPRPKPSGYPYSQPFRFRRYTAIHGIQRFCRSRRLPGIRASPSSGASTAGTAITGDAVAAYCSIPPQVHASETLPAKSRQRLGTKGVAAARVGMDANKRRDAWKEATCFRNRPRAASCAQRIT